MKPLSCKGYASIGHLSSSKLGPSDRHINPGMEAIATQSYPQGKQYRVIVSAKLDGSNVGVAKVDDQLVPIMRQGYTCASSPYRLHHLFHDWVMSQPERFEFLQNGERLVGEWLAQTHTVRYSLIHEPFVALDLFTAKNKHYKYDQFKEKIEPFDFVTPHVYFDRKASVGLQEVLSVLSSQHGEIDPVEGAVWRVENHQGFCFMAKWVRPNFEPGLYMKDEIWQWDPETK